MQVYWEAALERVSSLALRNEAREVTMGREREVRGKREKVCVQREKERK